MVGLLEFYIPDEPDCIVWSLQNQIAVCTPSLVHLLIPKWESDGTVSFERGFITLERLSSRPFDSVNGANSRAGLRQTCWWSRKPHSYLVLVTHSGKLFVLECVGNDRCHERSWRRVASVEQKFERLSVCCAASDPTGLLLIATEDGMIYKTGGEGGTIAVVLQDGESISKMTIYRENPLICTSLGRVLFYNGQWITLIDDGVIVPGPVIVLPNGSMLLCKFNRLYMINSLLKISSVHTIPGLLQTITAVLPNADDNSVLIVGMDGSCFRLSEGLITRVVVRPWISSSQGNEESDDEAQDYDEGEPEEDPSRDVIIQGSALSDGCNAAWVAETEKRQYPLPSRTRLFYHKINADVTENASSSSDQLRFVKMEALSPGVTQPPSSELMCTECEGLLSPTPKNSKVLQCPLGHIFNICTSSGQLITSVSLMFKCHRCSLCFHQEAARTLNFACTHCNGALLQSFPNTNCIDKH
ncbi:hypothetical protein PSACC_02617 [Paramicrosporidium saccamoebae]|uniref:Uncharacterized protein n=1 Tax=Paramicrosporidium saccamoebae TaxID=1246581 RepID=A0A2H9TIM7_9FUNG|nr:hypothetical protein PSACC_02617 [Paramicrosporidium saccamoebae]